MPSSAQTGGEVCPPTASYSQEVFAKAAEQASDRGFLWRAQRDGRTSYLYGTMHVGKAEWMSPGPRLRRAMGAVDTLALEVDMSSLEAQEQLQTVSRRPPREIPPVLHQRLERLWAAECLPMAQLGSGPVELQAMTLMAMLGRRQGYDPSYSSEAMLMVAARAGGLPVVSLESVRLQLNLLLAENDAEAIEAVAYALKQLEEPQTRAMQEKLTQAWEESDLAVLASYQAWCDCVHNERERADLKKLLDDRNPGLAEGIERLHANGQRVLAAVGALHMTGPQALPRLLADRGFTVERLF
jgi:uncharacterized protein